MTTLVKRLLLCVAGTALLAGCQENPDSCDCMRDFKGKSAPVTTDKKVNLTDAFARALDDKLAPKVGIISARHDPKDSTIVTCELSYNNSIFGKAVYNYDPTDKFGEHYTFIPVKFRFKLYQNSSTKKWDILDANAAFKEFIRICSIKTDSALNALQVDSLLSIANGYAPKSIKPCNNLNVVIGIQKVSSTDQVPTYSLGWLLNYANSTAIQLLPAKPMDKTRYETTYHNLASYVDFSSGVSKYGDIELLAGKP